jgi:hypothetical protein
LYFAVPGLSLGWRTCDLADTEYSLRAASLPKDPSTVADFRHFVSRDTPGLIHMALRFECCDHPDNILVRPPGFFPGH